jgi:clan AA aspartic protease (TIGR02281 family)
MRIAAAVLSLVALATPARLGAEIYTWTDAEGRVHYTQDLQGVPPAHRAEARERAAETPASSRVQTFESAPAAAAPPAARRAFGASASRSAGRRVHQIPVERAGSSMVVMVRINGSTIAPFVVDTGASYVLMPKAVAEEAGIEVGPDTRRVQFGTANGVVEQAVVTIDSLELGTASAEDVPGSISDSMDIGLLGLSFFNRFNYQVDTANGVLTLIENDLVETGGLRGGRSEQQWRNEFGALRMRMEYLDEARSNAPSTHGRLVGQIDEAQQVLERELEQLESEANDARVPDAWRQ